MSSQISAPGFTPVTFGGLPTSFDSLASAQDGRARVQCQKDLFLKRFPVSTAESSPGSTMVDCNKVMTTLFDNALQEFDRVDKHHEKFSMSSGNSTSCDLGPAGTALNKALADRNKRERVS